MKMTERWQTHFSQQIESFKPYIRTHVLAMRVLAVVTTRMDYCNGWSAYIDAVPGMDHSKEYPMVLKHGDKLPEVVARVLFPEFETVPYIN